MMRKVWVGTVQPIGGDGEAGVGEVMESGLGYLLEAAKAGVDILCLPEYFNCMGCDAGTVGDWSGDRAEALLERVKGVARAYECYVILPMVVEDGGKRYNRAVLIDRAGDAAGHYDKVHLTRVEREQWGITAGDEWPVFGCDFGRIGVMTCYDGCFAESARVLGLGGAEIIFWPSLQRSYSVDELSLQVRGHAYFNQVAVVRSSYGRARGEVYRPGAMVGMSCICDADGTIAANLGVWAGWTSWAFDLDEPLRGMRSFGGEVGKVRAMREADRRPGTYGRIVEG